MGDAPANEGWRQRWERAIDRARERAELSRPGQWLARRLASPASFARRLQAGDLISRGMLFAAIMLLCFIPFLLVLQSLAGRDAAAGLVRRFGLSPAAADAVRHVLTSPARTSAAVTGLSWVFFIFGGIAAAGAIQEVYQRAYHVTGRGIRDTPRRLGWLAVGVAAVGISSWAQPWLYRAGGPLLVAAVSLVAATGFWWFSMWLLLAGRQPWLELLPSALATGFCWFGMELVFRLTMSNTIVSNYRKYGSIGVVFALMSYLIAVGVVIILGASVGVIWRERHPVASRRRAAKSPPPTGSPPPEAGSPPGSAPPAGPAAGPPTPPHT